MLSPEMINQMTKWRAEATAGTLPLDEMKKAIIALRESRRSAESAAKAPSKGRAPKRSADDILAEFDAL